MKTQLDRWTYTTDGSSGTGLGFADNGGSAFRKNPMGGDTLWAKWYAKTPEGYRNTGVYCSSSDSYLYRKLYA